VCATAFSNTQEATVASLFLSVAALSAILIDTVILVRCVS